MLLTISKHLVIWWELYIRMYETKQEVKVESWISTIHSRTIKQFWMFYYGLYICLFSFLCWCYSSTCFSSYRRHYHSSVWKSPLKVKIIFIVGFLINFYQNHIKYLFRSGGVFKLGNSWEFMLLESPSKKRGDAIDIASVAHINIHNTVWRCNICRLIPYICNLSSARKPQQLLNI